MRKDMRTNTWVLRHPATDIEEAREAINKFLWMLWEPKIGNHGQDQTIHDKEQKNIKKSQSDSHRRVIITKDSDFVQTLVKVRKIHRLTYTTGNGRTYCHPKEITWQSSYLPPLSWLGKDDPEGYNYYYFSLDPATRMNSASKKLFWKKWGYQVFSAQLFADPASADASKTKQKNLDAPADEKSEEKKTNNSLERKKKTILFKDKEGRSVKHIKKTGRDKRKDEPKIEFDVKEENEVGITPRKMVHIEQQENQRVENKINEKKAENEKLNKVQKALVDLFFRDKRWTDLEAKLNKVDVLEEKLGAMNHNMQILIKQNRSILKILSNGASNIEEDEQLSRQQRGISGNRRKNDRNRLEEHKRNARENENDLLNKRTWFESVTIAQEGKKEEPFAQNIEPYSLKQVVVKMEESTESAESESMYKEENER